MWVIVSSPCSTPSFLLYPLSIISVANNFVPICCVVAHSHEAR